MAGENEEKKKMKKGRQMGEFQNNVKKWEHRTSKTNTEKGKRKKGVIGRGNLQEIR